ncbi:MULTISPECIES: P-loop NTPase fold protein [unclassified Halomonas]|uniref:P-loop NTPase fold protein n=1 Tax=unclassified Halomonas TaxID=2609666 RepID=UPI001C939237|nr:MULTISPECIES: P-loop NTPase fold protein [unclassified Halomonas]MBY5924409.1 KAP family NTPase [Halomonas sp. DP4Y7-2]MBY6231451.1 KAP family NTPase [Halomonas sp. DP4Y7-1]
MDRNQHVKEYLTYYTSFPHPPRYAVLLNGPWGIGKTHLLKEFLGELPSKGIRYIYLSLYGLTTLDEIDDVLFRAMYPVFDNKSVKITGRAVKALGKYLNISVDLKAKELLDRANAEIFVFDDLERCNIPVNRVLGYINEFVEHEGRKVLIICNEREIKDKDDYTRVREKLIGKTLEIQSALEQALSAFLALAKDDQSREFMASQIDEVSIIYHQSELHNLRVLQQTIWDFERFYTALEDKHRNNNHAMTALLRMLFALSFEIKTGRLTARDLLDRQTALLMSHMPSAKEKGSESLLVAAQQRYPEARLDDTVLSDETLTDLLIKGVVDKGAIRTDLDASTFFVSADDEPAWRTVWYAFERTEEEFDTAFYEMERAFDNREYESLGEILHVFGLRLWLAKIGAISCTLKEVIEQGMRYIDDLYAEGRLQPLSPGEDAHYLRPSSHGGLGFHESKTAEYKELFTYLQEKRDKAASDRYPILAEDILKEMSTSPELFFHRVNLISGENSGLYNVPVLAELDPKKFVAALLDIHPAQQCNILMALKARYERKTLDRELVTERPWASEVRSLLLDACKEMSPISRYRIHRCVMHSLDDVLGIKNQGQED